MHTLCDANRVGEFYSSFVKKQPFQPATDKTHDSKATGERIGMRAGHHLFALFA